MNAYELNMDGLVGPTHHYAGLAKGNLASAQNAKSVSNPLKAALQGLAKMRFLHKLGFKQALLPPHQRPNLELLYQLGFTGSPISQISKASRMAPELLSAAYSASSMWTANAATVSSSLDSKDGRVHFTAANLISNIHRHQEAFFSSFLLEQIFNNKTYFVHHSILPTSLITSDEGAANHSRLCEKIDKPGINFFVYGKRALNKEINKILRYPARQTLEASMAIARKHQLDLEKTLFACQNPKAIDEGVFHNDVIATANESLLLVHEEAFLQQQEVLDRLQTMADFPIQIIEVSIQQLSLKNAVETYLFNSQILSLPNQNKMLLLAPSECEKNDKTRIMINDWIADKNNPISLVEYLDLKQSMRNGGGPACLRLRVPLTEPELRAMHQGVLVNDILLDKIENWVKRHYREELSFRDLSDPLFVDEVLRALDELSQLLNLGSIYPFQRES